MSGWYYAFSLSAQEVQKAEPPGTIRLIDHQTQLQNLPKPTSSPQDPLNWPKWRKYAVLFTMSLYAAVTSFGSAVLAPALLLLPLHAPPTHLAKLTAMSVLLQGTTNIFWVPLANIFGRRLVLIVALTLATVASIWAAAGPTTFGSLLGARALQGCGFGPADSVAPIVIAEVFFVHERGRAMTIYTACLAAAAFLGGIVGSYIATELGYRYIFWITTVLMGFNLLCQIFLVPETSFVRRYGGEHAGDIPTPAEGKGNVTIREDVSPVRGAQFGFAQSLRVGVYRGDVLKNFLAPWRSLLFPGTWVVMLHYGSLLGGTVTMSIVGPMILARPPYLWGADAGLMGIGGLIGSVLGAVSNYLIVDGILIDKAKKSTGGFAEPESRLPAMVPGLFLATTGIWTFGFCAADLTSSAWAGLAVGFGMLGFGLMQVPSIGFNYLIDAYSAISADCFVMTTIVRGVVSFAWTFFVSEWIADAGSALPFGIFGMLMAIFSLLLVPLWLLGKRMRIATAGYLPDHTMH